MKAPDVVEVGPGEAAERAKRRRKVAIFAAIGVVSFLPGFYLGYTENERMLERDHNWPAAFSLFLAAFYVIAAITGAVLLKRQTDELAIHNQYRAIGLAASMFVFVYPVWFILWKGGFVPEPMHFILYVAFLATALAGMLYYRFK